MVRLRAALFFAAGLTAACSAAPPEQTVITEDNPYAEVPPEPVPTPEPPPQSDFQRRQETIRQFEAAFGGGVTYEPTPADATGYSPPARLHGKVLDVADDADLDGVWTAKLPKGRMSKIISGPGEEVTLFDRNGKMYSRHEAEIQVFTVQGNNRDWYVMAWMNTRAIVKRGPLKKTGTYKFELNGDQLREHANTSLRNIDRPGSAVLTWTRRPEVKPGTVK